MEIQHRRIKYIREELGLTQSAFAQILDCGNTTADLERGRKRITGKTVMLLLKKYKINPLWLFGESPKKHLDPQSINTLPKVISINPEGTENIHLVHAKASAGYADNLGDPDYIQNLPAFSLPLPQYHNSSFRGFQVEGDSMLPAIHPGEWIVTQNVSDIQDIRNDQIYVIVQDSTIRIKKVHNDPKNQQLLLLSLNPDYTTVSVPYSEIREIWKYHSKISTELHSPQDHSSSSELLEIKKDLEAIRKQLDISQS